VASTGTAVRELVLGYGNKTTKSVGKTWCIRDVTVHVLFDTGVNSVGTTKLLRGDKVFGGVNYTCGSTSCGDAPFTYVPPRRVSPGSTLTYQYTCGNNPDTIEDECADANPDGTTIIIHYEAF
jgi:hypothetical protein